MKASGNRAISLIRVIVEGVKLKQTDEQGEFEGPQSGVAEQASQGIKASAGSEGVGGRGLARRGWWPQGFGKLVSRLLAVLLVAPMVVLWMGERVARVDSVSATISVGPFPGAVAVNPVTNKIYVANIGSADVTVIDGNNNSTTTVVAGSAPKLWRSIR